MDGEGNTPIEEGKGEGMGAHGQETSKGNNTRNANKEIPNKNINKKNKIKRKSLISRFVCTQKINFYKIN